MDLVIKAPRKGFIARTLSEDELKGHYALTRLLLSDELEKLTPSARRGLPEYEPIAVVLNKLGHRTLINVNTLAAYTGEVFTHIAALGENAHVILSIRHANDHLHYIHTLECQRLNHVQSELARMCELLLSGDCVELISAIHAYHDLRVALLPELLDSVRR